ncbi:MAG: hypothetical protein Q4B29_00420 [Candidatus Saccharibacteria bacterium]|nr:hypothetical protein [Candidatus Saccharibacteria bacterium]
MENLDYLNQISGDVRPTKSGKPGFMSSPFFKLGVGGLIALILILILGAILNAGSGGVKEQSFWLELRLSNTLEVVSTYQANVKSSDLRSSSASLYGILSNTERELNEYLAKKYNYTEKSVDKKMVEEATLEKDGLSSELFEAKINGNLDRIYAHKMAYEISLISSKESSIYGSTKDEELKGILETSFNSLNNLYEKFNSFSETN